MVLLLLFRHNNIIPMKSWSKASLMQTIVYFYAAHSASLIFLAFTLYTQGQTFAAHSHLSIKREKKKYIFAPISNQMHSHDPCVQRVWLYYSQNNIDKSTHKWSCLFWFSSIIRFILTCVYGLHCRHTI